jgi:hypothetical protein
MIVVSYLGGGDTRAYLSTSDHEMAYRTSVVQDNSTCSINELYQYQTRHEHGSWEKVSMTCKETPKTMAQVVARLGAISRCSTGLPFTFPAYRETYFSRPGDSAQLAQITVAFIH